MNLFQSKYGAIWLSLPGSCSSAHREVFKTGTVLILPYIGNLFQERSLTHYPIDDRVNGLTEEQVQLRETVFNFCQKVVFQLFKMALGQNAFTKRWRMT